MTLPYVFHQRFLIILQIPSLSLQRHEYGEKLNQLFIFIPSILTNFLHLSTGISVVFGKRPGRTHREAIRGNGACSSYNCRTGRMRRSPYKFYLTRLFSVRAVGKCFWKPVGSIGFRRLFLTVFYKHLHFRCCERFLKRAESFYSWFIGLLLMPRKMVGIIRPFCWLFNTMMLSQHKEADYTVPQGIVW